MSTAIVPAADPAALRGPVFERVPNVDREHQGYPRRAGRPAPLYDSSDGLRRQAVRSSAERNDRGKSSRPSDDLLAGLNTAFCQDTASPGPPRPPNNCSATVPGLPCSFRNADSALLRCSMATFQSRE